MGFFISLFAAILLMLIGSLVNYWWYHKHDKNLFRFIADRINYDDDLILSTLYIALIIIILLLPLLNVVLALSINIGLFIKGVD